VEKLMTYIELNDQAFGFFDAVTLKQKGVDLHEQYAAADPFPHIAIDDFVSPEILNACLDYFPDAPDPDSQTFDRNQERYKTSFNPDYLPAQLRSFFYALNSQPFISFLENMTGVEGLIPDPYFLGGGFHETKQGGHLSVHADFNFHPKLKLERRLNLLIYLNKDWEDGFGGELELWDVDMKACVRRVVPAFNRCVVFSTNATSYHGHPAPVNHPQQKPRRSIALYYYTATWDGTARDFTTQFKKRPESSDKIDWSVKRSELINDFLPPIVARNLRRVAHRLSGQR
jgi:2-oxoglutarate-Fe(II)-dependent oxygenase superfamily protein